MQLCAESSHLGVYIRIDPNFENQACRLVKFSRSSRCLYSCLYSVMILTLRTRFPASFSSKAKTYLLAMIQKSWREVVGGWLEARKHLQLRRAELLSRSPTILVPADALQPANGLE